ncbi:hypothetical protein PoHVEF18_006507 [Penicillium ochrochloron]
MIAHEVLACLELAIYVGLLLPATFCTIHFIFKGQFGWLYLHAFVIAKIAGPAIFISITEHSSSSSGLQIAAQILYQIALGPLMSATLSFVNISSKPDEDKYEHSYSPLAPLTQGGSLMILRLVHPIIICGLVLGIIGGIDRMPDSSTGMISSDKYDRGATFMKVSGALFLVAFVAICFGVIKLWKHRKGLATVSYYIVSSMVVVLPLLFLRILYSVLNSANLDTTGHASHTTKYNIMNGSWVIYLILGVIPQATIITIYIASGVFAWVKIRRGTGV